MTHEIKEPELLPEGLSWDTRLYMRVMLWAVSHPDTEAYVRNYANWAVYRRKYAEDFTDMDGAIEDWGRAQRKFIGVTLAAVAVVCGVIIGVTELIRFLAF